MSRAPAEHRLRRNLAANVRTLRERHGLTLEEAAGRCGMHWRHWQKIEAGEVNVTLRTLGRVSECLGAEAGELLMRRVLGTAAGGAEAVRTTHEAAEPKRKAPSGLRGH